MGYHDNGNRKPMSEISLKHGQKHQTNAAFELRTMSVIVFDNVAHLWVRAKVKQTKRACPGRVLRTIRRHLLSPDTAFYTGYTTMSVAMVYKSPEQLKNITKRNSHLGVLQERLKTNYSLATRTQLSAKAHGSLSVMKANRAILHSFAFITLIIYIYIYIYSPARDCF